MARLAWLTDLHLDFIDSDAEIGDFCRLVCETDPDAILISGDIGNAGTLMHHLELLEACIRRPIYFVLGNHDFYGSSIAEVRQQVRDLCRSSTFLRWLPEADPIPLGEHTCLVGHDSWGDGRCGLGAKSEFMLNDYYCIRDFQNVSMEGWFEKIAALGDEAAAFLRDILQRAFDLRPRVLLLTHVPPFREAAWYLGRPSPDDAVPHFACKAVGDVLLDVMRARPQCHLTVLCGHTHSPGVVQILPNLEVRTGQAEYGAPALQPDVVVAE